jgi:hypothetical protein
MFHHFRLDLESPLDLIHLHQNLLFRRRWTIRLLRLLFHKKVPLLRHNLQMFPQYNHLHLNHRNPMERHKKFLFLLHPQLEYSLHRLLNLHHQQLQ